VRILVVGASGFIGTALVARLVTAGHEVVAVSRSKAASPPVAATGVTEVALDVAQATRLEDWAPVLAGVEAVVNCAGALQEGPSDSLAGVHAHGISALFRACERAGIRRVVHLSATGVDTPVTAFSRTKLAGDQALMALDLDWVVLRPSVVVGRQAYGGSALLRGLAALPLTPVLSGSGPLQIVHIDDVVAAILFFLRPDAPSRRVVEVVGPRRLSLADTVRLLRRWLRWPPAPPMPVPSWVASIVYRLGDIAGWLDWRPPLRSTTGREILRGATGDADTLRTLSGVAPRDVEAALAADPASVQERWFARLYLLKALIFVVFALFWISTGLVALGPGWEIGMDLMREGGVDEGTAVMVVAAGALADIAIGLAIAFRPTTRYGLYAALTISLAYTIIGTTLVPRLWSDPLGPMLKIWPIITLNLAALAILEER
jgi:uncharacterized protein YbjT (DUF2867 family)